MKIGPLVLSNNAEIMLPASKSISNRLLIIQALSRSEGKILNLSAAQDTIDLRNLLECHDEEVYVGEGGTTLRFYLAYLFITNQEKKITASESLTKRPHHSLFIALEKLGARFEFEKELYTLPCKIVKRNKADFLVKKISIDTTQSSQFVSAMMMIAPLMPFGLVIELSESVVSRDYIMMTLQLMAHHGIDLTYSKNKILINPGEYKLVESNVESDWSSAAFFFCMAALHDTKLQWFFPSLKLSGLQADQKIIDFVDNFGIKILDHEDGVFIIKNESKQSIKILQFDLKDCPDLFPVLMICCAMLHLEIYCRNLQHLAYKESNRLAAITEVLQQMGSVINIKNNRGVIEASIDNRQFKFNKYIKLDVQHDHRLAMAYSLWALRDEITISDGSVVNKSFPNYWDVLQKLII